MSHGPYISRNHAQKRVVATSDARNVSILMPITGIFSIVMGVILQVLLSGRILRAEGDVIGSLQRSHIALRRERHNLMTSCRKEQNSMGRHSCGYICFAILSSTMI
jgi:hypothetical protein